VPPDADRRPDRRLQERDLPDDVRSADPVSPRRNAAARRRGHVVDPDVLRRARAHLSRRAQRPDRDAGHHRRGDRVRRARQPCGPRGASLSRRGDPLGHDKVRHPRPPDSRDPSQRLLDDAAVRRLDDDHNGSRGTPVDGDVRSRGSHA
jgi:hypothetical protein